MYTIVRMRQLRAELYSVIYALVQEANYYGSLTQASTTSLGMGPDGKDVYIPVKDLLPMLEPNDIEFDGKYNNA